MNNLINKKTNKTGLVLFSIFCLTSVSIAQETNSEDDKIKATLSNIEYQTQVVPMYTNADKERDDELKKRTDIPGKLTLKTGVILEGTFRFEYRQTKDGKIPQEGNLENGDAGKIIWHLYQDQKGKNKMKAYKAKDISNFYINELEVYHTITYKPDLLKTMETAGSLDANVVKGIFGGKTQKLLLHIYSTDKACLYYFDGEFILKKANDFFAIVGPKLSAKDLSKFAKDCEIVSNKALKNEYAGGVEKYLDFIDDYTKYKQTEQ